jgi:hypothetical protein
MLKAATSMTGAAGEHLVMSRLLARGFIAALAPQGAPNLDVVVSYLDGSRLGSIQVKTRWDKGADGGWHMGKKHEKISHPRMFYTFVDLGKTPEALARVYVVPSAVVANVIKRSHETWLSQPGKNGHVRKDSNMRRFLPNYSSIFGSNSPFKLGWLDEFYEAWDLLKEETA